MAQSGVNIPDEVSDIFMELKTPPKERKQKGELLKFIIYKLSDDKKQIEVEEASTETDWEVFREKLVNSKTKTKSGSEGQGHRFAVYDFEFDLPDGAGTRNRILFVAWAPDSAPIMTKMVYSTSKEALKLKLNIVDELQANDEDDIEWDAAIAKAKSGKR